MPLDPSIYSNVGRVNFGSGLSSLLDQQRAREQQRIDQANTLASLVQQRELGGLNIRKLQREEAQAPQELEMLQAQRMAALTEAQRKQKENALIEQFRGQLTPEQQRQYLLGGNKDVILGTESKKDLLKLQQGQRGQIIFDNQGNAFNVNPYDNSVRPIVVGGAQIQGAQYAPSLQGQISGAKATGSELGKATGEAQVKLQDMESMMPRFETLTKQLSDLGKEATYTKAGQASDITKRELGLDVGRGAVARKEYISLVDNEILPLLRQTFGAAFTVKEGESLRATLGDPNASPDEKDAVLRSFIKAKQEEVKSLKRKLSPVSAGGDTWRDL